MILYRIAREKHAHDLSGNGGLISSARWHDHMPVIYTSITSSTCILETLVHVRPEEIHNDLHMIVMEAPDDISSELITALQLPSNWNEIPGPPILKQIGNAWLKAKSSALLIVPSAVDPFARNVIINPLHADISMISIKETMPYTYDERLFFR
jgi:RES domain-containing protein